jgi:ERCC4-type nuclease
MIEIFVDTRETDEKMVSLLERLGATVKREMLDIGDYICSDRAVVERKTMEDFLNSIIDHRLFDQLCSMKEHFECPVLIIEGSDPYDHGRKIHPNVIRGVFASIVTDYKVPTLWTKNSDESAAQIFWIAKREQDGDKRIAQVRCKTKTKNIKEEQEFLIAGLPNISTTISERLLKTFKTPEKVFSATEKELIKTKGVGKVLAKKIKRVLTTDYE